MYYKLSQREIQDRRARYRVNPIYKILYTPLWKQRGNDLSPVEVWEEANKLAFKLKSIRDDDWQLIVAEFFEDLCKSYSTFIDNGYKIRRDFSQAEHSAMMVTLTAFLLLANTYPEAKGHPYLKVCQSLIDVASDIPGYKVIYEEARKIEDEYESKGEFIEVADYIEQIANRETPLTASEIQFGRKIIMEIIDEGQYVHLDTMKENEILLSRVNDKNEHCFQNEINILRERLNKLQGEDRSRLKYENIIFAKDYEDKITDIRDVIYRFIKIEKDHIDERRQNQWLAIIEPLKRIDGLLITHDDKPRRKECSDDEICQQMKIFFEDQFKSIDFSKIPKSISSERSKWRARGVGLSFSDWERYYRGDPKYKALAKVASRLYGELLKVIREGK